MSPELQIIPAAQIDNARWDECIAQSSADCIYAKSFYLHHLADQWHGIIFSDYTAVMPVPWRKKWGIRYAYQVPFVQQLGLFGEWDEALLQMFVHSLQSFCRYGDYAFHSSNGLPGRDCQWQNNFVLDLSTPYPDIKKNYKTDLLQNLRKAANHALTYQPTSKEKAIDLFFDLYRARTPHVSSTSFYRFKTLCDFLQESQKIICREVCTASGETQAIILLLQDANRLYNMMNSTPAEGRKIAANHFLVDAVIQEFSGSSLLLDFEGSDIPGIKSFYENFGAVNEPYGHWLYNCLPWPIRLFKK